jgi:hypothetical protein
MRKFLMFAVLVLVVSSAAQAQLKLYSREVNVSEFNSYAKEYVNGKTLTVGNYITFQDGRLTITCLDCPKDQKIVIVTHKRLETVEMSRGLVIVPYIGYMTSSSEEVSVNFGYNRGSLTSVAVSDGKMMMIYQELKKY